MAVNKFMTLTVQESEQIRICFSTKMYETPRRDLKQTVQTIKQRFQAYQHNQIHINAVLNHPGELILLILNDYPLSSGLNLQFNSELPIGCGMGASAAVILASLTALNDYFKQQVPPETLYQKALTIEHYQHGTSSGLDIAISQEGGLLLIENNKRVPLIVGEPTFFAINTGSPESTTGECVEAVKQFEHDTTLWQRFAKCTYDFKSALEQGRTDAVRHAIQTNHQLLTAIGVVPEAIQQFILNLESIGFSAKISGAGSISGNKAGMLLASGEDETALKSLCEAHNYTYFNVSGEASGARTD